MSSNGRTAAEARYTFGKLSHVILAMLVLVG